MSQWETEQREAMEGLDIKALGIPVSGPGYRNSNLSKDSMDADKDPDIM